MTLNELQAKMLADKRSVPSINEIRSLPEADKTALAVNYAKLGKQLDKAKNEMADRIHEQAKFLFVIEPDAQAQGKTLAKYYRFKTGCDRAPEPRANTLNEFLREMVNPMIVKDEKGNRIEVAPRVTESTFDKLPTNAMVLAVSLYKNGVSKDDIAVLLNNYGWDTMKKLRALRPKEPEIEIPPAIEDMIKRVEAFVTDSEPEKLKEIFQQLNAVTLAIEEKVGADTIDAWLASQPETAEVETANA